MEICTFLRGMTLATTTAGNPHHHKDHKVVYFRAPSSDLFCEHEWQKNKFSHLLSVMCMCITSMCVCAPCVWRCPLRTEESIRPPGPGAVFGSCLMWVLGFELMSSSKKASVLTHLAISLVPGLLSHPSIHSSTFAMHRVDLRVS